MMPPAGSMSAAPEIVAAPRPGTAPLLEVDRLAVHFPVLGGVLQRPVGTVKAVDGVSFSIARGQTLGLVGESGCGKSTTGNAVMRLVSPTGGVIRFDGADIAAIPRSGLKPLRRRMQMVFQDPYSSMNPRLKVLDIIGEPLTIHGLAGSRAEYRDRVHHLLEVVGLDPMMADRYPHEFSGGQRQRICVARALAVNPALVVLDEPVSALDVSIQAQLINLLEDLQERLGLTYLFIAHDLAVVRHISDRIAVMYLGRIVEIGTTDQIFANPLHPYTRALLSAVPIPDPDIEAERAHVAIEGEVPSPISPPSGCHFHPRCPQAMPHCRAVDPRLADQGGGHATACHLYPGSGGPG